MRVIRKAGLLFLVLIFVAGCADKPPKIEEFALRAPFAKLELETDSDRGSKRATVHLRKNVELVDIHGKFGIFGPVTGQMDILEAQDALGQLGETIESGTFKGKRFELEDADLFIREEPDYEGTVSVSTRAIPKREISANELFGDELAGILKEQNVSLFSIEVEPEPYGGTPGANKEEHFDHEMATLWRNMTRLYVKLDNGKVIEVSYDPIW